MKDTKNNYIALIADIKNSRKIDNREVFQNKFINVIKKLNEFFYTLSFSLL